MAVWQFKIELIPREWAIKAGNGVDLLYTEDGYYDVDRAWIDFQPSKDLRGIFQKILPPGESWTDDMELWGNTETHDISLWTEDGKV